MENGNRVTTAEADMTLAEAIELAIEALKESADHYHFYERAVNMLGAAHPAAKEARKGLRRKQRLLEAIKLLQKKQIQAG